MDLKTTQELYALGFRFKQVKLWSRFTDTQVFAVRLPDGKEGYCSVMGMLGLNLCLAMYLGVEGFSGYWRLNNPEKSDLESLALSLERQGVFCSYDDKEDVTPEDIKAAQQWARKLNWKLTRPYPYPHFERCTIGQRMQPIQDEQEAQYMKLALEAGLFLSYRLAQGDLSFRLVPAITSPIDEVPLLVPDDSAPGGFRIEKTQLPGCEFPDRPVPAPLDEFTLARLQSCKPTGTWDVAIAHLYNNIIEERGPAFVPSLPACYQRDGKIYLSASVVGDSDHEADDMFFRFVQRLIELDVRPEALRVLKWDDRAQAFFQPLAKQLGIPMQQRKSLPEVEEFMMHMIEEPDFKPEELKMLLEALVTVTRQKSLKDLYRAAPEFQSMARLMLEEYPDHLPADVRSKIESCLDVWF